MSCSVSRSAVRAETSNFTWIWGSEVSVKNQEEFVRPGARGQVFMADGSTYGKAQRLKGACPGQGPAGRFVFLG